MILRILNELNEAKSASPHRVGQKLYRAPEGKKSKGTQSFKGRIKTFNTIKQALSNMQPGGRFTTDGSNREYVVTKRKWGTSPVDGGNPVVSGKVAKGFTPGSATPSSPTKFSKRTMLRHGTSNSKSLAQEVGTRALKKKFK